MSSDSRIRLDWLWALNRGANAGVLADFPDADLSADLNVAEELISAHSAVHRWPARRWFVLDATVCGDPVSEDDPGSWPIRDEEWREHVDGSALTGVVINADRRSGYDPKRVLAWVAAVRRKVSGAATVVVVRSESLADGLLDAIDLAGQLTRREPVPGDWAALSRLRPGAAVVSPPKKPGRVSDSVLPKVLTYLRWQAERFGGAFPVDGFEAAEVDEAELLGADPAGLAGQLFSELRSSPITWNHEAILRGVRDHLESCFQSLLRRYAAEPDGPGWGTSLAIAAAFESDLDTWLGAAPRLPVYSDLPLWSDASVVRRVAAGLARFIDQDAVLRAKAESWVRLGYFGADPESQPSGWDTEAFWRYVTRRRLSAEVITGLDALPTEKAYLLAVAGLISPESLESILADHVVDLRNRLGLSINKPNGGPQ